MPDAAWRDSKLNSIKEISKQKAAVEFAFVPGLKMLIVAAAEMPGLKNLSPNERRERVRQIAFPPAPAKN